MRRNPDKRIGTHVFTAVARTDDGGLRWTAVTIDGGDNAEDALDRVTIPQDVLDRVAPTALPRSANTKTAHTTTASPTVMAGTVTFSASVTGAVGTPNKARAITRGNGEDAA